MRSRFFFAAFITLSFCSVAFAQTPSASPQVELPEVVKKFYAAYIAHDVEAMLVCVEENVKWFSLAGDSIVIETSNREALREAMTSYFKSPSSPRSEVEAAMRSGSYLAVRERAFWKNKAGVEKSQFALALFEVHNEKIVRVWYLPAEK